MKRRKSNIVRSNTRRTGVAILECALVMPVLMLVLFAMLDLGLAAVRYNALADASRRVAREVILHGSVAPTSSGMWGPTTFSGTAASGSVIVAPIQNTLRSEEHTSELQSLRHLVCRLLLEKKKK